MGKLLSWLNRHLSCKSEKQQYKQDVIKETSNVEFSAITHDWEKSKRLYDVLKKKCHPDLYTGEKNVVATQLFQMLTERKYNYTELIKIKERGEKELGFSI